MDTASPVMTDARDGIRPNARDLKQREGVFSRFDGCSQDDSDGPWKQIWTAVASNAYRKNTAKIEKISMH